MSRFSSPWRITSGVRLQDVLKGSPRANLVRGASDCGRMAARPPLHQVSLRYFDPAGPARRKGGRPGGGPSFLEQLARMHAERTRELADVSQPHVNPRVFDLADEVLLLAGIDRKRRLRQPLGLAQPAHVLGRQSFDVYGPPHRTTYIELDIFSRPLQTIGVAT